MRGINSLPILFIQLILLGFPQPIHAQSDCSTIHCSDENLPIQIGDVYTWQYTRDLSDNFHAFTWDLGIDRNILIMSSDIAIISIEILRDLKEISQNNYPSIDYDVSMQIGENIVDTSYFPTLQLSYLIYPTIMHVNSSVVNSFEYFAENKYEEYYEGTDDKYIFRTSQHDIIDGIYYRLDNMTFSKADSDFNPQSFNYILTLIEISTGFMIYRKHFAVDFVNSATYLSHFSFQDNTENQISKNMAETIIYSAPLSINLAPIAPWALIVMVIAVRKKG